MPVGKKGIAPCGHPGTYITTNLVTCDWRCEFDDVPDIDLDQIELPPLPMGPAKKLPNKTVCLHGHRIYGPYGTYCADCNEWL